MAIPHERISFTEPEDSRLGHIARYQLAAGWCKPGDTVVDAACGNGYGRAILEARGALNYYGVDRDLGVLEVPDDGAFHAHDLTTWGPDFAVDVAVGFETLEHLADPAAYVRWTRRARVLLLSIPLYPTVHENPHHLHDYSEADILAMFQGLKLLSYLWQPAERSGIWVFGHP